jgi:hypothetical protein
MQTSEQQFFNVAGEEIEARGAGGMTTIMLCVSAVFVLLAIVVCVLVPAGARLDATVTKVSREEGAAATVTLNKGSKDGLAVGTKLLVWNKAEGFKGKLTVSEVRDGSATARIDWESADNQIKDRDVAAVTGGFGKLLAESKSK